MDNTQTLQDQLARHRRRMSLAIHSDNFYFTSGRREEDLNIERKLKQAIIEKERAE